VLSSDGEHLVQVGSRLAMPYAAINGLQLSNARRHRVAPSPTRLRGTDSRGPLDSDRSSTSCTKVAAVNLRSSLAPYGFSIGPPCAGRQEIA
jgi:hypothetical protein